MRVYMSATLPKILLGIASAGALFVSPVRAETAPTSDSAEALKEAQVPSDVSSPSPSGAEQLLPLNPPSPIEPAGATGLPPITPPESAGASELQPVTPDSTLESEQQAVPEASEDGVSDEVTGSSSSPETVSTSEEEVPPVGGIDEPALEEEEAEVITEEDSTAVDSFSSPEGEDVPLVEGSDDPALEEGGSAAGEQEILQEESEITTEEEDSSAIGGAEDLAPEEGTTAPIEDTVDSEDASLENSESEDPTLLDENEGLDGTEESDISPSSAIPDASPQLVAEGEEPAIAPEASSEDVSPASETEGETTSPSSSSDPSATPVSDQELQQFANSVPGLRTVEQSTQEEISAVIQGAGFDEARFGEIFQSQQSPEASTAEVTEQEQESFSKALSDIQVIEQKSKAEQEKVIQAQGLEPERFVEILITLRQDPNLQTKLQQMIEN